LTDPTRLKIERETNLAPRGNRHSTESHDEESPSGAAGATSTRSRSTQRQSGSAKGNRLVAHRQRDAAYEYLKAHHTDLYELLLNVRENSPLWIDVRSLPIPSQRWIWLLYTKHYPDCAQWLRDLDMGALRAQFGATLILLASDILSATQCEVADRPRSPPTQREAIR
jgi:hypothetical protein